MLTMGGFSGCLMRAVGGVPDDLILTTKGFAAGVKRTSV